VRVFVPFITVLSNFILFIQYVCTIFGILSVRKDNKFHLYLSCNSNYSVFFSFVTFWALFDVECVRKKTTNSSCACLMVMQMSLKEVLLVLDTYIILTK